MTLTLAAALSLTPALAAAQVTAPPAVAPVPVPPAVAAPSPALRAHALELARLLNNEATLRLQTTRMLRESLPAVLKADASFQLLEQQYPGISGQFIDVMEPIAVASILKQLPGYQVDIADLYMKYLTDSDVVELTAFFRSPLGVKLLRLGNEGVDYTSMLQAQVATGGNATITSKDIGAAIAPAVGKAVGGLDPTEQREMLRFTLSPVGRKLPALNAEVRALAASRANRTDPEAEAAVTKAVTELVQRRMAEAKK